MEGRLCSVPNLPDETDVLLPLVKAKERQHTTSATLFRAIGIVALQIAGCADAAVVNLLDTGVTTLPDNFRGKINLVMRRSNAWAQLRNQITRLNPKHLSHPLDRLPRDS